MGVQPRERSGEENGAPGSKRVALQLRRAARSVDRSDARDRDEAALARLREAGVRVELTLDHGRLVAMAPALAPKPGAEVSLRLLGGVRFPR